MKVILAALMALICCDLVLPAVAADKDSPFFIDKREFKKQYKTIALGPVDADPMLQMPDSVRAIIEEEVTRHLQKRGYTVLPASVVGDIRNTMEAQVGGFEDPETGRIDTAKVQAVRTHAFRELWFRHDLNAIATIRVSATSVPVENDNAKWDGAKQSVERDGRRRNYTGQIFVSSVSFAVYDQSNKLMYLNYGGLEVLMRRSGDQLVPLPPEQYFMDEKRIRKAAQIAISPI